MLSISGLSKSANLPTKIRKRTSTINSNAGKLFEPKHVYGVNTKTERKSKSFENFNHKIQDILFILLQYQ